MPRAHCCSASTNTLRVMPTALRGFGVESADLIAIEILCGFVIRLRPRARANGLEELEIVGSFRRALRCWFVTGSYLRADAAHLSRQNQGGALFARPGGISLPVDVDS